MIIALTGYRYCGKSTFARLLQEELHFNKVHAFAPGLKASEAYWNALGVEHDTARRLVYGDLKDTPFTELKAMDHLRDYDIVNQDDPVMSQKTLADFLPGVSSRDFMEKFGKWMGTELGRDYTLLAALRLFRWSCPEGDFVVESIVYEADDVRREGGFIIRLNRDEAVPRGLSTDKGVEAIIPDMIIDNNQPLDHLRNYIRTDFIPEVRSLLELKQKA